VLSFGAVPYFAPFRPRLLVGLLDVALLRLRALLVAVNGIIANLTPRGVVMNEG